MKAYRERRTRERYECAVALLDGHCARCGTTEGLEFDHIQPGTKAYDISRHLWDYSWERLLLELAKCQLLCHPCHRAKTRECGEGGGGHNRNTAPHEHGTMRSYQETGCRCALCRQARAAYRRKLVDYRSRVV